MQSPRIEYTNLTNLTDRRPETYNGRWPAIHAAQLHWVQSTARQWGHLPCSSCGSADARSR